MTALFILSAGISSLFLIDAVSPTFSSTVMKILSGYQKSPLHRVYGPFSRGLGFLKKQIARCAGRAGAYGSAVSIWQKPEIRSVNRFFSSHRAGGSGFILEIRMYSRIALPCVIRWKTPGSIRSSWNPAAAGILRLTHSLLSEATFQKGLPPVEPFRKFVLGRDIFEHCSTVPARRRLA